MVSMPERLSHPGARCSDRASSPSERSTTKVPSFYGATVMTAFISSGDPPAT